MASFDGGDCKLEIVVNEEESVSKKLKTDDENIKTSSQSVESIDQLSKSEDGLGKVVASHYNNIEEKGIEARNLSRIVYMRNFNNWVKSVLIIKVLEDIRNHTADEHKIVALDLGCGKGGDILKWQKGNIRHLICADIAGTSVEQCKERYEYFKQKGRIFSAEFIVADCTKSRLKKYIKCPESMVDIVSCQFSFHYCFESLPQAETMIRNISDSLRKGGYFIATCPDANKIVSLLDSSKSSSYGNEVFKIEFPKDRPSDPPLFGDTYNFFLEGVVNCPEFLVHFPTLVRLCEKYGLSLEYKKTFEEIYQEGMNDRESRNLLFRMKAMEVYPPTNDSQPAARDEDVEYGHAKNYIEANDAKNVKTLSKSEWDAICLYTCFAFKKIR